MGFAHLSPAPGHEWLSSMGYSQQLRIGATSLGAPVGLAVVAKDAEGEAGGFQTLTVCRGLRGRGIGTLLLRRVESEARAAGFGSLRMSYFSDDECAPAIESMLRRCDWGPPTPDRLIAKAGRRMLDAPWIKQARLPKGFTIVPWDSLDTGQRDRLLDSQRRDAWIPPDLNPFYHERDYEPSNSVALRTNDSVVGWVMTRRLTEDILHYVSSYVHPDYQRRGSIIPLYARSIGIHCVDRGQRAVGIWSVPLKHRPMVAFTMRRMRPYAEFIGRTKLACKKLS